jgi:hypothetical protein
VLARALADGPGPAEPPGLYAGQDRRVALNVVGAETELTPAMLARRRAGRRLERQAGKALKGRLPGWRRWRLLAGRRPGRALGVGAAARPAPRPRRVLAVPLPLGDPQARARAGGAARRPPPGDDFAIEATRGGGPGPCADRRPEVDEMARPGFWGLGDRLWQRTSVEPLQPMGVDHRAGRAGLLSLPLLAGHRRPAATPSAAAYAKLNQFLRTGGMILFDTRDADITGLGGTTPEGAGPAA